MSTDPMVPHEEFRQRTALVQRAMAERGVDLLILDQSEKCYYLLGYDIAETLYRACLVPAAGEAGRDAAAAVLGRQAIGLVAHGGSGASGPRPGRAG